MKKITKGIVMIAVVFFSLLSVTANAQQQKHTPEQRATMMTDKMKSAVSLSDDQYKQVYAVNLKYAEKMQALRGTEGAKENKKEEFKALRKEQHKEINGILTDEQREKFKAMKQDGKKKHRGMKNRKTN